LRAYSEVAVRHGRHDLAREVYEAVKGRDPTVRDLGLERAIRLVEEAPPPEPPPPPPRARPSITFADVGGLDALKERLRMDIVYPIQRPDLFKAYGKKTGGGVLLYGPPGVGKTHLARAAAGECEANFVAVEIQHVLDMWLGESEKRIHQIFEQARDEAPTILFFDEIEAIGAARHQLRHGPGRRMVNQLLAEMDGIGAVNDRVLVLGATNAPWDVDPALRRPGRFDRVIFVPPPDVQAREAILRIAFRERPTDNLDFASIARKTSRYSGADLTHLAEVASERALGDALRTGKVRPINASDVLASLDRVKPTTTEWLDAARRYVTYANQAGLYDDVAKYLEKTAE
jgi:SpoVK/Ycf46/Vps4 family AAA+-type ATPase